LLAEQKQEEQKVSSHATEGSDSNSMEPTSPFFAVVATANNDEDFKDSLPQQQEL
jgi:hypothetical protein